MKIHLRQIPSGDTLHVEEDIDASPLGLEEAGASAASPLHCSLDAGLSDGGFFATGQLGLKVRLKCVACLELFDTDIFVSDFAVQKDLDGREAVDLTEEIREDIHLALPPYPRCDTEGHRTCPASFPLAPAADSPIAGSAAWDALDKLKTDN